MKIRHPFSFIACVVISILIWGIFHPGVMSLDSIYMYFDAIHGNYSDLHPPLLPMVVSIILKLGGNLGLITFGQIVLGTFGLRNVVINLVALWSGCTEKQVDLFVVFLLGFLFSPLSPAAIYFVTLWTDIWLVISLLWSVSFLLAIYRSPDDKTNNVRLAGYLLAASVAMLVRYNALVTYPFLCVLADKILRHNSRNSFGRVIVALTPLLVFIGAFLYQTRLLEIKRTHPEYASYALDLASMIVVDPTVCTDLYIQSCTLVYHEFSKDFIVGDGAIDFTLNQNREEIYRPFLFLFVNPRLPQEFATAARDHPLLLVRVKLLNYMDYIGPDPTRYFYQDHYPKNDLELVFAQPNTGMIAAWFSLTNAIIWSPLFRWVSFVHAPWLILNLAGLFVCMVYFRRIQHADLLLLILLVPASYSASYLLFFTASEFRFMYPSMLLVQVVSLSLGLSYIVKRLAERKIRARASTNQVESVAG